MPNGSTVTDPEGFHGFQLKPPLLDNVLLYNSKYAYTATLDPKESFLALFQVSLLTRKVAGRTEKLKTARTVLVYKTATNVDKPRLAPVRSLGPPTIVKRGRGCGILRDVLYYNNNNIVIITSIKTIKIEL